MKVRTTGISAMMMGAPTGTPRSPGHTPADEQRAALDFAFGQTGFTAWQEVEIDVQRWEAASAAPKKRRSRAAVKIVRQGWATMAVLPQMLRSAVAGFSR